MTIQNPYKLVSRSLIIFLLIAGLYVYLPSEKPLIASPEPIMTITMEVNPGDTLWTFAEDLYPENPRKAVFLIKKINGLDNDLIYPGQILEIPGDIKSLQVSNN